MKGKWQLAPLAFPWRVFTTAQERGGSVTGLGWLPSASPNPPGPALTYAGSQCPELVVVKVGIALDAPARGKGMGQEPVLAIEGIPIPMLCRDKHSQSQPHQRSPRAPSAHTDPQACKTCTPSACPHTHVSVGTCRGVGTPKTTQAEAG